MVGQAETLGQALSAVKKFAGDVLILEAALAGNAVEAISEFLRQAPGLRVVVVTQEPNEELTLELFRRGVHGIVSREVEPELLVEIAREEEVLHLKTEDAVSRLRDARQKLEKTAEELPTTAADRQVAALAAQAQAWFDLERATGRIRSLLPEDRR